MSFTDDFFSELDKKKKKKKTGSSSTRSTNASGGKSYSEKFMDALGDDISPLPSPTMASIHKYGEDDIAPVKGGDKDSWFKSGGFSDGVDGVGDFFVDLGQTVLGTAADVSWGVAKGAGRMVEGLVDLGTYGVAEVADKLGADEFAEKANKVARYNATDEWTKDVHNFVDRYSILGNKADAVSEGLGQVGAIILTGAAGAAAGLGAGGVAALTTGATGLSSMGTNMGDAFESGATDDEAFWYGLSTGAIEAGTELLFGGLGKGVKALGLSRGIGGLDEIFAKKLSSKIAGSLANESVQKALGNTVEYAVKAGGEGVEEVLSGLGSAVMKKLTYADDKTLRELIEDENLLEQFVVGTVVSGIAQGGDFVKATKSGTDFVTGHTAADEKVIDKVVEEEVAKREAAGEKLSAKDKNKIYDSVVDQMEKGQIDIDTIESVLGGDTYKAYKETVASEDALKNELAELRKMKSGDMNDLQTSRMNELKGMNLDDTTKRDGLRKNLDDMLSPMLKGSKLTESYRERERRGQAFEADLSKYTGKQRAAVERAVKSGVLNNTYRSHELVNVLSKIEAEKGIVFDYTNNAKLKDSGFAVDGKTVNGFANKSKGTVTLNVQSNKAWQFVVGHEITHVLETNPEAYNALRESLYAYAESKGELESRRAATTALYDGMDADIEAELTADLVGDYLFTDKDFVKHLTGNRTMFQKIYDEIKYLWNKATGKEKTEIEKVKDEFDRVWKEFSVKGTSEEISEESKWHGDAAVQFSIKGEKANLSEEDRINLQNAKQMKEAGKSNEEIYKETGWYTQSDGKWRTEIPDEIMNPMNFSRTGLQSAKDAEADKYLKKAEDSLKNGTISEDDYEDLVEFAEGIRGKSYNSGKLPTFLDAPHLYDAYPQLKKVNLFFEKLSGMQGYAEPGLNKIVLDPDGLHDVGLTVREGLAHEIQHIIQNIEGFTRGSNPEEAGGYEAYRKTGGEIESRDVEDRLRMTPEERRANMPVQFSVSVEDKPTLDFLNKQKDSGEVTTVYRAMQAQPVDENGNVIKAAVLRVVSYSPLMVEAKTFGKNGKVDIYPAKLFSPMAGMVNGKWSNSIELNKWEQTTFDLANATTVIDKKTGKPKIDTDKKNASYGETAYYYGLVKGGLDDDGKKLTDVPARYNPYIHTSLSALNDQFSSASKRPELVTVECIIPNSELTSGFRAEGAKDRVGAMNWHSGPTSSRLAQVGKARTVILTRYDMPVRVLPDSEVAKAVAEYIGDTENIAIQESTVTPSLSRELMNLGISVLNEEQWKQYSKDFPAKTFGSKKLRKAGVPIEESGKVQYSISDSNGNELSLAVQKRFANSKAVDENGNLKVLYHGTYGGEFYTFDKSKGNVEGDFGSGFYFTDSEYDVESNYEDGGPDFENKVARLAEQIEAEEEIDYHEAEARARKELYKGGNKFEVYLNIENPAIVGETYLLNPDKYYEEYDREDYDSEEDYEGEVEQLISDDIDQIIWDVENNVDVYSTDGLAEVLWNAVNEGGIDIEQLKKNINDLYLEDSNGNLVGNEVTRQVIESLGYDGIIDPTVSHKWNMDMEEGTTHYIVFKPNQIKNISNQNPTDDPDIRYSISPETDADYMSAVERGDTETAQMMVDEAAKNAGYTRTLYHGTASKFNVFGFGRTGIFTTNNFDMAKTYGNNVMSLYGKEGANVLHIDAKESPHWAIEVSKDVLDFSEYPLMRGKDRYSTNDISLIAFREGYDVVVIDNVYDNYSAASGNTENGLGTDVVYKDPNQVKSSEAVTYDDNGNVIPLSQRFNEKSDDIRNSLSNEGEEHPIKGGTWRTPFRELAYGDDIAPTPKTVRETPKTSEAPSLADIPVLPDEPIAEEEPAKNVPPMPESDEEIIKTVKERLNAKITNSATELEETKLLRDWVKASYENKIDKLQQTLDSKKNKDTKVAVALRKRIANLKRLSADVDADIQKRISDIESRISKTTERLQDPPKKDILEVRYERIDKQLEEDKIALKEDFDKRKAALWESTQDKPSYISNKALDLYNEVKSMRKGVRVSSELGYLLDNLDLSEEHKSESYKRLRQALIDIKNRPNQTVNQYSEIESIAREMLNSSYEDAVYDLDDMDNQYQEDVKRLEADAEAQKKAIREQAEALHRADVQRQKLDEVNSILHSKGFDLDEMIDNPVRQLSTLETVDTMPQRVLEKTFGYEAGQALADATVNKVAQNESAGMKWLDSITNRKNGLLAQLSKKYNIKPHSKEIEAAMMYGEGSWVNEETGEEFAYGDAELAKDFPNVKVQNNIKALVRDPRIRKFYDETLDAINESRKRNGYPEIPRRANYFLHYRELGDFFTKNGLPFNPNDARAKDLPTDMVGRTADLKPGQPFFTSSWQRKGKKTSYDLFEGMERYANSAKNQIYHIDDIQTLRALHYHLAERFGQAQGLEDLNKLTPEEASEQIKKVYGSHLSTFAAFLDTEANILAGKTSMIDRALSEGMLGRRILTFMDALNQQTGATMVGYNVSSANTNWLPVVREFANSNPVDSVKALAQTVANIASRGRLDSFREDSTVYIRRQGADRFNRKLWQKLQDPAYALMGAVDSISTEIIARTEYNKAIREGMNPQQAHYESDKKVSRLMADRSLGQMPQMYTSRIMGLITKFQLEVRNDMDSMFYDTLQEEKLLRKDIENALERNAKTAAKVAWRYGATAVALHAFGQAFEAVAGYNPAFDIIEAITKAFGWDDDEDDEDTWRDNLGEGAMSLLEDLPYAGIVLDGGRIPISSALPDFKGIITGKDEYGNEKSLGESFMEIAPYMLPAGGNQFKKTYQGLKMFSDDHPVSGSYTDSGSLRFPVEDTHLNRVQAALFGQYASKNAREYFDNDYAPLNEKQIQEFIDVDMPIKEYREYREGLKKQETLEDKFDYISGLDLPVAKKNILINNVVDRKEAVDLENYEDFGSLEEFDFATKNPEKYAFAKSVGGYSAYKTYSKDLGDFHADKDENGKKIKDSRKEKVLNYINNLDADFYTKVILYKSEYPGDDTYNRDIVNYINEREDLSYEDRVAILSELGFRVTADGQIYAD